MGGMRKRGSNPFWCYRSRKTARRLKESRFLRDQRGCTIAHNRNGYYDAHYYLVVVFVFVYLPALEIVVLLEPHHAAPLLPLRRHLYPPLFLQIFASYFQTICNTNESWRKIQRLILSDMIRRALASWFVRGLWGSLYSVYLSRHLSISLLAYWNNLLLEENIMSAISQSQRIESSIAFFMSPFFLFVKVA